MNSTTETSQFKKVRMRAEAVLFPLILFLWPLAAVSEGVNVADTTYSLGNFRYLGNGSGSTWFFATFLANELGKLFTVLPGGNTMRGMNLYTGFVVSAAALLVYFVLQRVLAEHFGGEKRCLLFCGEFLAESCCWCPTVILYNYLTYFLLTLCCLFLILAVDADGRGKETGADRYFLLAGVCLGLNVLVRLSNLPEAALILAVWFALALLHRRIGEIAARTGFCILGYGIGFGGGWLLSAAQYGPTAYFKAIPETFAMSSSASDYTAVSMLRDILNAYGASARWMLYLVPCVIAGFVFFRIPFVKKHAAAAMLLYGFGLCLLVRLYWGHGMFTVKYQDYWCMFQWGMFVVILSIVLDILAILGLPARGRSPFAAGGLGHSAAPAAGAPSEEDAPVRDRFLGALSLLVILIVPIGSNNYTFPVLNCLFITAPLTLCFFAKWVRASMESCGFGGSGRDKIKRLVPRAPGTYLCHISWQAAAVLILMMATLQSGLFHVNFAFGDGTDGTERSEVIRTIPYLDGMHTTPENAGQLTALYDYLEEGLLQKKLLAYGDAPGLNVICGMEPAIDTTWPDLASYSYDSFREQLEAVEERAAASPQEYPVIIRHLLTSPGQASEEKNALVDAFLVRNGYACTFANDGYEVYTRE